MKYEPARRVTNGYPRFMKLSRYGDGYEKAFIIEVVLLSLTIILIALSYLIW